MSEENEIGQELIHHSGPVQFIGGVPDFSRMDLVKLQENFSKHIAVQDMIRKTALRLTNKLDWLEIDGQPYLEISGTTKIASCFGVQWQRKAVEKTNMVDEHGPYIFVEVTVNISFNGRDIEMIGTASTRDDFFGKKNGAYKPLGEIDLGDILKKAETNALQRGVKRLSGLESFTWEELEQATEGKITQGSVQSVKHGAGTSGGANRTATPESVNARNDYWNKVLEMAMGDIATAQAWIVKQTEFKGQNGNMIAGMNDIQKLSDARFKFLSEKIDKSYAKFKSEKASEANPDQK